MKKVLFVCSVASMIDQFNMANIQLLQKKDCEVHVAANFEHGNTINKARIIILKEILTNMGVVIHHMEIKRAPFKLINIKMLFKLKKLIKDEDFSLIHCQSPIGGTLGRLAASRSGGKDTHVIYTAHGFHFFNGAPFIKKTIFYVIEKFLSHYTDTIITINKEDYEIANRKFKNVCVEYIHGIGINTQKFSPCTPRRKRELRLSYGYSDGDYILVYVAELCRRKNQMMLIDSIIALSGRVPGLKLILVGIGPMEQELREYVKAQNLDDIIYFAGYSDRVIDYLNMADAGVSTSQQEGLPVNIMECMSAGLPVIATDCRGNIDLVEDDINGYVVPIGAIDSFVQKIVHLYESPDVVKRFSKKNLSLIDQYSKEVINDKMDSIYSSLL